jgi:hypothetical protein
MVFFGVTHVFLHVCWIGIFGENRAYFHLEASKLQEVFLSKTNSILSGKQCAWCSCFYHRLSFLEIDIFLHLKRSGVFQKKWAFLYHENSDLQEIFFSKTNSFSQGTIFQMLQILTMMVFFGEIHGFLWLSWIYFLGQTEPTSTLKYLSCSLDSFQIFTQFSQGYNVLDATVSNTDGFLLRHTCISSP